MEYKIGDWVVYIDKEISDTHLKITEVSFLYGKVAKIIDFKKDYFKPYILEFKEPINGQTSNKGKSGHCWFSKSYEFKSLNHLKFKKWIEK